MKKFLSLIIAVALCGCASHHVKPVTAVPVVAVDHTAELAAVRSAVLPAIPAAKVAASAAVVLPPASVVSQPVPAKSPAKSHKLAELVGLLIALAVIAFFYGVKIYTWGAKLVKKVLAWIKAHNVVANLKALAAKADAEAKEVVSKIEVDFQKDKAAVSPAKPTPIEHPAPITAASVSAAVEAAHAKPASKA